MNIAQNSKYLVLLILIFFVGCSVGNFEVGKENENSLLIDGEVAFSASMNSDEFTRTYLDPDMSTTRWSDDDKLYLWAYSTDKTIYSGTEFSLKYYGINHNEATFIGSAEYNNEQEVLRYLAIYPKPNSISGNNVTYNIPTIQRGDYDGKSYDIMYARPTMFDAFKDGEISDLNLSFSHLMHSLCITIPDDRNLLEEGISSLEIDFPTNVVGDITFDISGLDSNDNLLSTNPEITLSNGSSSIVLNFDQPIYEGDNIWLFIAPTKMNGEVKFRAISANGLRSTDISANINKTMESGRVTPITLTIPAELPRTTLNISINKNNLGEDPTTVTFTAPEGGVFLDGTTTATLPYSMVSIYKFEYYASLYGDAFKNGAIKIDYDSPNATVDSSISLANVNSNNVNNFPIEVPYLMFEDFSSITTFNHKSDYQGSSAGTGKTITLTEQGLPGWTADRAGGEAGLSLRTACRLETGLFVQAVYNGRLDSAPISNLKEGSNVAVRVWFSYSGDRQEEVGSTKGTPKFAYGYTDDSGELDGGDGIEHTIASGVEQGLGGSYSSVGNSLNYTFSGCTNDTRLSWRATVSRSTEFAQNGNYWLYIDNIKVSIE